MIELALLNTLAFDANPFCVWGATALHVELHLQWVPLLAICPCLAYSSAHDKHLFFKSILFLPNLCT